MSKTAGFITLSAVVVGIAISCVAVKLATEKEEELSLPLRWTAGVVWVEAIPCLYRLFHCRKPYDQNAFTTRSVNALKRLIWDPWFIALGVLTVGGMLATNYYFEKKGDKAYGDLLTVGVDIVPAVMFVKNAWRSFQATPMARRLGCYRTPNRPATAAPAVPVARSSLLAAPSAPVTQPHHQPTGATAPPPPSSGVAAPGRYTAPTHRPANLRARQLYSAAEVPALRPLQQRDMVDIPGTDVVKVAHGEECYRVPKGWQLTSLAGSVYAIPTKVDFGQGETAAFTLQTIDGNFCLCPNGYQVDLTNPSKMQYVPETAQLFHTASGREFYVAVNPAQQPAV